MKVERICVIVCGLALSACNGDPTRPDPLVADENQGIVFFSVTHDAGLEHRGKASFCVDGGPRKGGMQVDSLRHRWMLWQGSDFVDSYGYLVVRVLPAGRHEVDCWRVDTTVSTIVPTNAPSPLVFDVIAGQAKYLGNLHARIPPGDAILEVRDERERDVKLFDSLYPQFQDLVVLEPLALGRWTAESDKFMHPRTTQVRTISHSGRHRSSKGGWVALILQIAMSEILHQSRRAAIPARSPDPSPLVAAGDPEVPDQGSPEGAKARGEVLLYAPDGPPASRYFVPAPVRSVECAHRFTAAPASAKSPWASSPLEGAAGC